MTSIPDRNETNFIFYNSKCIFVSHKIGVLIIKYLFEGYFCCWFAGLNGLQLQLVFRNLYFACSGNGKQLLGKKGNRKTLLAKNRTTCKQDIAF